MQPHKPVFSPGLSCMRHIDANSNLFRCSPRLQCLTVLRERRRASPPTRHARTENAQLIAWLTERGVEPCKTEHRRRFHAPSGARRQLALSWEISTLTERNGAHGQHSPCSRTDQHGDTTLDDTGATRTNAFEDRIFHHELAAVAMEQQLDGSAYRAPASTASEAFNSQSECDVNNFDELMDKLRCALRGEPHEQGTVDQWYLRISRCFEPTQGSSSSVWQTGAPDREAWATGAHVVCILTEG